MTSGTSNSAPKLKLPRVQSVRLHRFSLFAANPDAEFSAGPGVLCLVGANGIGKSTLLSAINFCLTGTVPDPTRTFESMDEYYKFTRQYSANYFRGRIAGVDEADAEITVVFNVGEFRYEVRRGLFEPEELRGLAITSADGTNASGGSPIADETPRLERHRRYAETLVQHSGFASFEEFVFLQHFVLTFDEQRKTLFWNSRIMDRVLYRAFGLDPSMAKQVDSIRREIQHEDSRVRNHQWEATRMRKRINEIRSHSQEVSGAQSEYDQLVSSHEALSNQFEMETKVLRETEDALRDASLRLAELSVRETSLRDDYARFFDGRFRLRPPMAKHPLIVGSIKQNACGLCGSDTPVSVATISGKAVKHSCPLCDAALIDTPGAKQDTTRLQEIDTALSKVGKQLQDLHASLQSLREVDRAARTAWEGTKEQLDEFDRKNTATLDALRTLLNQGPNTASLATYREQLALMEKEKKAAYEAREKLKRRLGQLQKDLEEHYVAVEHTFVPRFAELAQLFLGMPLSVQMDARGTDEAKLVVAVRGTTRRQQQHLSESQRFFLDIALRMALTQHMSDPASLGAMFIDTPEGSLDIAYEKRAGEMLAKFAKAGHQIIMTANLNSSRLLLELAKSCGSERMTLCKMMDWSELSEVQQEEEALFDDAYELIEQAMN